jgi:hypothetical protein
MVCVFPVPGGPWIKRTSFSFIWFAFSIASIWEELYIFEDLILSKKLDIFEFFLFFISLDELFELFILFLLFNKSLGFKISLKLD